ncbi:MAG: 1-deoxy-D-xylulose-5-phosphate reductoisomerase, partial [Planctomycetia bacterium]|nr:1-deoxy-D-xylulose-5-phosphate reductoisomerase [Planctomycetia bacterium]
MMPLDRPAAPADRPRRVAVLGSTGSIGRSTLEVIAASEGRFTASLLCGHRSVGPLLEQAAACRPRWLVVTDPTAAASIGPAALPPGTELVVGAERLAELVAAPEIDQVVSAIVGAAGLASTWAAVAAGKPVALANKETLVMAGPLVMRLAA